MEKIINCNVTIMVSDMDKSIDFYTNVLELTLKNRYGNHWADISGPGIAIGLHPASENVVYGTNMSVALRVENLEKAIASLSKKGVECKKQVDEQVKIANFNDPDKNALYLVESKW